MSKPLGPTCEVCDRVVEDKDIADLSTIRFRHVLCAHHFVSAKQDGGTAIKAAIVKKKADMEAGAAGYYEQERKNRAVEERAKRLRIERDLAEEAERKRAFDAERRRIRETKEFF